MTIKIVEDKIRDCETEYNLLISKWRKMLVILAGEKKKTNQRIKRREFYKKNVSGDKVQSGNTISSGA